MKDPNLYPTVDEDNIGIISSQLLLWSFPIAAVTTFLAGYVYDIIGRRLTTFISFFSAAIAMFFVPYTAPNVFPGLLLMRMLLQLFISGPTASPLPADYVHKDSMGLASVLVSLGTISGEVVSMGILFPIT